ncbi:hypothetical protein Tco_0883650 [Tanacetum coccineum]
MGSRMEKMGTNVQSGSWMFQNIIWKEKARAWFDKLPPGSIDNWGDLQEKTAKGEFQRREGSSQWVQKNDRPQKNLYDNACRRTYHRSSFRLQGSHTPYVTPYRPQQNLPRPREHHKDNRAVLTLDSLKGKGGQKRNDPQKGKIINIVNCVADSRKRKSRMIDEDWMNVPIVFPPMRTRDLSEEAIMVEAEIEGYLVRRIHVDEGASLEIIFNTTAGNPVKKILLKLNLSDHRLFKDGGGDFRYSDTTHLSRSVEVLKLKNFKKDATLKLSKSTNQESSRNKLNPEVNDHYNIFSRESQEYELKTKDEA